MYKALGSTSSTERRKTNYFNHDQIHAVKDEVLRQYERYNSSIDDYKTLQMGLIEWLKW
jgi:hypothetical protein